MASSGSDKPRVPPPPPLRKPSAPPIAAPRPVVGKAEPDEPELDDASTAEHAAPTAAEIAATAPTPTFAPPSVDEAALDGDAEGVDMSARELDVLFDGEADEAANEPAPKPKYALPRPKPVKSKAAEFASSPLRTESGLPSRRSTPQPLSGNVPKGIKPPAAGAKRPEDTDVLIAALGAELMDDDEPAAGESVQGPAAPAGIASSVPRVSAASQSFSAEGAPLDDDLETQGRKPPWIWIAAGALAAVVVAAVALSWGDDAAEPAAVSRSASDGAYSASMSAENEKDSGQAKPVVAARREAPPVDEAPTRAEAVAPPGEGEPEAELAVAEVEEVADAEVAAEVDAPEPATPTTPTTMPEPAPPEPTPVAHERGHHKRNKHRGKHQERTVAASAAPPPSSPNAPKAPSSASKSEPSAEELLVSAKKALASGNNSAAYSLAAKARRLKKTTDALQVMAKAGCRMGSENKAKAAFSQLPFGMKAGIRSECRAKGIKLGL